MLGEGCGRCRRILDLWGKLDVTVKQALDLAISDHDQCCRSLGPQKVRQLLDFGGPKSNLVGVDQDKGGLNGDGTFRKQAGDLCAGQVCAAFRDYTDEPARRTSKSSDGKVARQCSSSASSGGSDAPIVRLRRRLPFRIGLKGPI